jgi:hypothetical protein
VGEGGIAMMRAGHIGDRVPARVHGRVHSVFARACNIEIRSGELVTLLAPELGAAPHGIGLDAPVARFDAWLRAGQDAILDEAVLRLPDARIAIDLSTACVWHGAVAAVAPSCRDVAAGLGELRDIWIERAPRHGIAGALVDPQGMKRPLEHAFALRLAQTLPLLARATQRRDVAGIAAAAARLVGLGPGLTPAGDDFLAGYLAALHSRAGAQAGVAALLPQLAAAFAPLIRRTHIISRQVLEDALDGRFVQTLVDVTFALVGAGNIGAAATRALACGHSSGADALCGLLSGYAPGLLPTDCDAGGLAAAA